MVAERLGFVAAESVELSDHGAVGLVVAVDRVAIEGDGDGLALAELFLEEDRRVVVVIVISLTAVATEVIELPEGLGVVAAVVERVEDRYAVGGESDGAAHEVRLGGHRFLRGHGLERDAPGGGAGIGLRDRHLLLPGLDTGHHRVVRQALGFDVEIRVVPADVHVLGESLERRGDQRGAAGGGGEVGAGQHVLRRWLDDRGRLGRRAILIVDRRDVRVRGGGEAERGKQEGGGLGAHDFGLGHYHTRSDLKGRLSPRLPRVIGPGRPRLPRSSRGRPA